MATRSNVSQSNPQSKSAVIIRRLRAYRFQRARRSSPKVISFPALIDSFRRRGVSLVLR